MYFLGILKYVKREATRINVNTLLCARKFTFLICETNIKRNIFTYCGTNFKKYSNKLIHLLNTSRYLKLNK